jgi:hypothetical protein
MTSTQTRITRPLLVSTRNGLSLNNLLFLWRTVHDLSLLVLLTHISESVTVKIAFIQGSRRLIFYSATESFMEGAPLEVFSRGYESTWLSELCFSVENLAH